MLFFNQKKKRFFEIKLKFAMRTKIQVLNLNDSGVDGTSGVC